MALSSSVVVLDFETTGLFPHRGDRITEVAALRVCGASIVDRYVTLVNAGVRIPSAITALTGISNEMIASAPLACDVVRELVDFIGSNMIVAHNASFDVGFLAAECTHARLHAASNPYLCTLRLARRLLPGLSSYRLGVVASYLEIRAPGKAHRSEADASTAADVLIHLTSRIARQHGQTAVAPELLQRVTRWPVAEVPSRLSRAIGARPPPNRQVPSSSSRNNVSRDRSIRRSGHAATWEWSRSSGWLKNRVTGRVFEPMQYTYERNSSGTLMYVTRDPLQPFVLESHVEKVD